VDYDSARFDFGYKRLTKYEDINPELFEKDAAEGGTVRKIEKPKKKR